MGKYFIGAMLLLLILAGCQNRVSPHVLGYLHSRNNWSTDFAAVDLSGITDLNLAFFNPDTNGVIPANPQLATIIQQAHEKKIRVFMSIGGGSGPAYLKSLMAIDKRQSFVDTLVSFAKKHAFDGVDVDIENDLINDQYAGFVATLATALRTNNLMMTAALASWNGDLIADSTLNRYDFINIMSYDKTGPWNKSRPGQHSPLEMAKADFTYFSTTRKIPASKLLIGLPFYGYGFGGSAPESMSYKAIVAAYPGAENSDQVDLPNSGHIYYNGIPTIVEKCVYAKKSKAAGVMIWELKQDSGDEKSLLRAIAVALH